MKRSCFAPLWVALNYLLSVILRDSSTSPLFFRNSKAIITSTLKASTAIFRSLVISTVRKKFATSVTVCMPTSVNLMRSLLGSVLRNFARRRRYVHDREKRLLPGYREAGEKERSTAAARESRGKKKNIHTTSKYRPRCRINFADATPLALF